MVIAAKFYLRFVHCLKARLVAADRTHASVEPAAGLGARPLRGPRPDGQGLCQGIRLLQGVRAHGLLQDQQGIC